MEEGFVRVAGAEEIGPAPFHRVTVAGETILLVRTADGSVRAFAAACPHLGQPLTRGVLEGTTLECRFHYYAYDLDTGDNVWPGEDRDLRLPVYETRVVDGQVYVRVPE